jgi:GTPase SAR1 family protein
MNPEVIVAIVAVIVSIIAVIVSKQQFHKSHKLEKESLEIERKKYQLEERIKKLEDYAKNTTVIEYKYQDIVILGPRSSGKTSIIQLWNKPWVDILSIKPTSMWQEHEFDVFELEPKERFDELFGVHRTYQKNLRVRIHDYPGEDAYRAEAIRKLPQLENPVILLVFDLRVEDKSIDTHYNSSYYSQAFMDIVGSINTANIAKVIVVFNKIDLLPAYSDKKSLISKLRADNKEADQRIESLFSSILDWHAVSAYNNTGIISLLGAAVEVGLPEPTRKQYKKAIRSKFGETFEDLSKEIG